MRELSIYLGVKKKLIIQNITTLFNTKQPTNTNTIMSTNVEVLTERVVALEKQLALLLSEKAVDVSDTKKDTKKPKKTKDTKEEDDDKPKKKRTSGYILYSNAHRDEVKESLTDGDEKPKNTDIMKKLAENWKLLSDEDRETWNTKAKELKANDSD